MKELWKPVRSGENYEVSNQGRVRNSIVVQVLEGIFTQLFRADQDTLF